MDKTGNVILGNCVSCSGIVRVPISAPANSTVRCPHCSESFGLAEILSKAIPELELVQEDTPYARPADAVSTEKEIEPRVPRDRFVVPEQLSEGAKRRSRSSRSGSSSSSSRDEQVSLIGDDDAAESDFDFSGSNSGQASRASRRSSSSSSRRRSSGRRSSSRRHRDRVVVRERNPTLELIKVVSGGVLALPIAYFLVMWIFNQDPLGFGKSLGRSAPFAVPQSMRDEPAGDGAEVGEVGEPSTGLEPSPEQGFIPQPEVNPDSVKAN